MALSTVVVASRPAYAHDVGTSELHLRLDRQRLEGEWAVHLPDARLAAGLDPDLAGEAGWREVRERASALEAYVGRHLAVAGDDEPCPLEPGRLGVEWHGVEQQVLIHFAATCPTAPSHVWLRCDLLFDLESARHVYFSLEDARGSHMGLFREDQRTATVDVAQFAARPVFPELVREGVRHIATGVDHLMFLLALLLPAPLVRKGAEWSPRSGLVVTGREVVKIVTAFTVAHSIALAVSFYGLFVPPAPAVEVAIATSVGAAAYNNLRPFLPGRAWAIALGFGLVHGLGFAGALKNLGLPPDARSLALAAFNVGVELGQLALVAAVLPLLYVASRRPSYPRFFVGGGSVVIASMALLWTLERGLVLLGASPLI